MNASAPVTSKSTSPLTDLRNYDYRSFIASGNFTSGNKDMLICIIIMCLVIRRKEIMLNQSQLSRSLSWSLCVCHGLCVSVTVFVCLSRSVCLPWSLCVYHGVCVSVTVFVCLSRSVCLPWSLCVYHGVCVSVTVFVCLSRCLRVCHSICVSITVFVCLSQPLRGCHGIYVTVMVFVCLSMFLCG